MKLFSGFRGS